MGNGEDLYKTGQERRQDSDIRSLRESIDKLREVIEKYHEYYNERLNQLDKATSITIAELASNDRIKDSIGKLAWPLVFVFLSTLGGLLAYGYNEIGDIKEDLSDTVTEVKTHKASGEQIARSIEKDIIRINSEIGNIRDVIEQKHNVDVKQNRYKVIQSLESSASKDKKDK